MISTLGTQRTARIWCHFTWTRRPEFRQEQPCAWAMVLISSWWEAHHFRELFPICMLSQIPTYDQAIPFLYLPTTLPGFLTSSSARPGLPSQMEFHIAEWTLHSNRKSFQERPLQFRTLGIGMMKTFRPDFCYLYLTVEFKNGWDVCKTNIFIQPPTAHKS